MKNELKQLNINYPSYKQKRHLLMSNIRVNWQLLSQHAWAARENAFLHGETAVGAALITNEGYIFTGCNVEHRYRITDVHAEVNAITNMVTSGYTSFYAILVAAERNRFTPCGSCLDWIMQFAGKECLIGYQTHINADIVIHTAHELMPFYSG